MIHEGVVYFGDLCQPFLSGLIRELRPRIGFSKRVRGFGLKPCPTTRMAQYTFRRSAVMFTRWISPPAHPIWGQRIEGQIVGTPLLYERVRNEFSQRVLAVPSGDDGVHVLNVIDGEILGIFPTDSAVKSSPVFINDFIYVHTLDGELKWFSSGDQTLQGCVALKDGGRCN